MSATTAELITRPGVALGVYVRAGARRFVRGRVEDPVWVRPALLSLLAGAALLFLFDLSVNGYANVLYSPAVGAATRSWKAFFFGSFDASNTITVDKPPGAFWVMDISARLFGVSPWSILAPQALEGVASVALLYLAVRRRFSAAAGLLAGLTLALTPVAALMFRFNNPDALLTLLLVASAYALTRSLEHGSTRWLALVGALVGFAFLAKMLAAFLVVPGFALVYLLAAPTPLRRRLGQLLASGVALVLSAGWWVAIVAAWPASSRPRIGGSPDNSILNLIFGYNGLERIGGNQSGTSFNGMPVHIAPGMWGSTGITRLFGPQMGTQDAWLLPAALLFALAILWSTRRAVRTDGRRAGVLIWASWLVVTGLVFSYARGIVHPYYTVVLAPAICALFGIGVVALWRERGSRSARLLLAGVIGGSAVWADVLLERTPSWLPRLHGAVLAGGLTAAALIALDPRAWRRTRLPAPALLCLAIAAVVAAPLAYTIQTVSAAQSGPLPVAGPSGAVSAGVAPDPGGVVNLGGSRAGRTPFASAVTSPASAEAGTDSSALRTAAAAAVGAREKSFWAHRSRGALTATGAGLSVRFGESGVSVSSGRARLSLRLLGVGRGAVLSAPQKRTVAPVADANRVSYDRGGLTEWYANGPLGLEQGFTLETRPGGAGRDGDWLTVEEELSGSLRAEAVGQAVVLERVGTTIPLLSYGDLRATDASGRALQARLVLQGRRLFLRVDDAGARYPLTIDPLVEQPSPGTGKLTEDPGSQFGTSVALSSDGSTAVVGAPEDGYGAGAAFVFVRTGADWSEQAELLPGEGEENGPAEFGFSVAISSDGNTVLVGAPYDTGGGENGQGAAWTFTRSGVSWNESGSKLVPNNESEGADSNFGYSVALSGSGDLALIGGPSDNDDQGAAWVYSGSEGSLVQVAGAKLSESEEDDAPLFGSSVALSTDGTTGIVGDPGGGPDGLGAAWVFTGTDLETQDGVLADNIDGADVFGTSVALSADGDTALVGDPRYDIDGADNGEAFVFTHTSGGWGSGTALTNDADTSDSDDPAELGFSVALSADGDTALVGAPFDPTSANTENLGSAWVYHNGGSGWAASTDPTQQLSQSGDGFDEVGAGEFGYSVALSGPADTALVGAPFDTETNNSSEEWNGAAWPFVSWPVVTDESASNVSGTSATLGATIDPNGTDTTYQIEYGTTAGYGQSTSSNAIGAGNTGQQESQTVTGLTPNTLYHYRVDATNSGGTTEGDDETFTTGRAAPTVSGEGSSAVTGTSATVAATVNPNGSDTSYVVNYGTTASYGHATSAAGVGSQSTGQPVSQSLTGLTPGTLYHYDVVATSAAGVTTGPDMTFTTLVLPTVSGEGSSAVTGTSATVAATVNPNGSDTSYVVNYGTTASYGHATSAAGVGSQSTGQPVSQSLTGLTPGTLYHYDVVATSAAGVTTGPDMTFTTLVLPTVSGEGSSAVTGTSATVAATVNPNGSDTSYVVNYGTTASYGHATSAAGVGSQSTGQPVSQSLTGLTPGTLYHYDVVATSAAGVTTGPDMTFTTLVLPTVSGEGSSAVTGTSATVAATVNPNGSDTSYVVNYGTTASYGHATSAAGVGSQSTGQPVSQSLTGLTPGTLYHYDVVATSAAGVTTGPDMTFTTLVLAGVGGEGSQAVTATGATVVATINPNGIDTSYVVNYGTTTSYGHATPAADVGSQTTGQPVSQSLTGLTPGTLYHYDVVATSAAGVTTGPDMTFTTLVLPDVSAEGSQALTASSATVAATINPNGSDTTYVVNYGTTTSYGHATSAAGVGSQSTGQPVSQSLTGLTPGTLYHYDVVATSAAGVTTGPDMTFTTLVLPTVSGEGSEAATAGGATVVATINPNGTDTTYVVNYGTTTSYGHTTSAVDVGTQSTGQAESQQLIGLTAGTTYHYDVVATSAAGVTTGPDMTFTTLAPPAVSGEGSQAPTVSSATVVATINPNGNSTSFVIDYGTTASYGHETGAVVVGAQTSGQAVSQEITGLSASTTYHFQVVATSAGGVTDGPDATFATSAATSSSSSSSSSSAAVPATPPSVSGEAVQTVNGSSATLVATVNPDGADTTYIVQYGTTASYGQQTAPVDLGSGTTPQTVSQAITGLTASTSYHYRFVATNAAGTTDGADAAFVTTTGGAFVPPTAAVGAAVPLPVQGVSADLLPFSGTVLVNGKPLLVGEQIPFGAIIDTTHGTVVLETELDGVLQAMQFAGGIFKVTQLPSGITLLVLQGGNFNAVCSVKGTKTTRQVARALNAKTVRSLWGNGHGKFEVKGLYAAATVRGTIFHVVDRCDGTYVKVRRGIVAVLDIATNKTVVIQAGHSFLVLK